MHEPTKSDLCPATNNGIPCQFRRGHKGNHYFAPDGPDSPRCGLTIYAKSPVTLLSVATERSCTRDAGHVGECSDALPTDRRVAIDASAPVVVTPGIGSGVVISGTGGVPVAPKPKTREAPVGEWLGETRYWRCGCSEVNSNPMDNAACINCGYLRPDPPPTPVEAENEACAVLCDEMVETERGEYRQLDSDHHLAKACADARALAAERLAARIRARVRR